MCSCGLKFGGFSQYIVVLFMDKCPASTAKAVSIGCTWHEMSFARYSAWVASWLNIDITHVTSCEGDALLAKLCSRGALCGKSLGEVCLTLKQVQVETNNVPIDAKHSYRRSCSMGQTKYCHWHVIISWQKKKWLDTFCTFLDPRFARSLHKLQKSELPWLLTFLQKSCQCHLGNWAPEPSPAQPSSEKCRSLLEILDGSDWDSTRDITFSKSVYSSLFCCASCWFFTWLQNIPLNDLAPFGTRAGHSDRGTRSAVDHRNRNCC